MQQSQVHETTEQVSGTASGEKLAKEREMLGAVERVWVLAKSMVQAIGCLIRGIIMETTQKCPGSRVKAHKRFLDDCVVSSSDEVQAGSYTDRSSGLQVECLVIFLQQPGRGSMCELV